jgi:uncharacterized protein (TIGR02145 family)
VPTEAEWDTADTAALGSGNGTSGGNSDGWDNNVETFESALKLPSAGSRYSIDGLLTNQGTYGHYWSSTVSAANARRLYFRSGSASTYNDKYSRAYGYSVRCLKD